MENIKFKPPAVVVEIESLFNFKENPEGYKINNYVLAILDGLVKTQAVKLLFWTKNGLNIPPPVCERLFNLFKRYLIIYMPAGFVKRREFLHDVLKQYDILFVLGSNLPMLQTVQTLGINTLVTGCM